MPEIIFDLYRSLAKLSGSKVDRKGGKFGAGIIRGLSIIETGPALGHDMDIDEETVQAVTTFGQAKSAKNGVKARFTHPDACNDGLGNVIGRSFDFTQSKGSDGKVRAFADLHILKAADPAKAKHVMDLAEESPDSAGISIVAPGQVVQRLNEDGEIQRDANGAKLPPVFRPSGLRATDVVDEAAANTKGLFGEDEPAIAVMSALDEAITLGGDAILELDDDRFEDLPETILSLLLGLPPIRTLVEKFGAGALRTNFELSSEAGLDRVAGFLNRQFKARDIITPPVTAATLGSAFAKSGLFKDGQKMFRFQLYRKPDAPDIGGGGGGNPPATPEKPPVDLSAQAAALTKAGADAEALRQAQIRSLADAFPTYNLKAVIDAALANTSATFEDTRTLAFAEMFKQAPKVHTHGTVQVLADERDKFVDAAGDAMLFRAGLLSLDAKDPKTKARAEAAAASGIASLSPQRMAMKSLRKAGMTSPEDLDQDALWNRSMNVNLAAYGHSSSDFPLILANAGNKALIQGFNAANVTWDQWCRIGNLSNFLTAKRLQRSESALFLERPEMQPAQESTFNEQGESITLKNWARAFSYSRQMFINDDLGAFLNLGAEFGDAANQTIEYQVYASLTSNAGVGPTMSDAAALFHANHANLNALSSGVPSQERLDAMSEAMQTQAGLGEDGTYRMVGAPPAIFLGAPKVASQINAIIQAPFRGTAGLESPQDPILRGARAIPVPMLFPLAPAAYYGVASQTAAPSYEVAFLNGVKQVRTQTIIGTTIAGVKIVADMDFATFPTGGWKGIAKNNGT